MDQYINLNGQYLDAKEPVFSSGNRGFRYGDTLFYILAGNFKREHGLDECLLVNQNNEIIEAPGSNIFLVRKNVRAAQ